MSHLNDLTALALPSGSQLQADASESRLSLSLDGQPLIRLRLDREAKGPIQLDERYAAGGPSVVGGLLLAFCS